MWQSESWRDSNSAKQWCRARLRILHLLTAMLLALVAAAPAAALPPPTTISPSGTISTSNPSYRWNAVPGATWYQLWVQQGNSVLINRWYTAAQVAASGGQCIVTPADTLPNGFTTFWVRAWNTSHGYGAWSSGRNFLVAAGLIAPTTISPSGTISTSNPSYRWNTVPGATWYQLWVSQGNSVLIDRWYTADQVAASGGQCIVTPADTLPNGSTTFWVRAWNTSNGYGPWSSGRNFLVAAAYPPSNNTCSGAATIGLGSHSFSTVNATTTGGSVSCGGGQIHKDVWFRFPVPSSGTYQISTCGGTSFDTVLAVYASCNGSVAACNDDWCGLRSRVTIIASAGQTILVRVGGFSSGASGTGTVTIAPVDSDTCTHGAYVSTGNTSFSTVNATSSGGSVSCGGGQIHNDVWFRFVAPQTRSYEVSTCGGASFDTMLAVYSSCGGSLLACNDDACGVRSRLVLSAVAGQTYRIRVGGYASSHRGTGTLSISALGGVAGDDGDGGEGSSGENDAKGPASPEPESASRLCACDAQVIPSGETMSVAAGAPVATGDLLIASGATLRVEPGSRLTVSSLTIEDGATLLWIGGTIEIDGGFLLHHQPIAIGCGAEASLELAHGAMLIAPKVEICESGALLGDGVVDAEAVSAGLIAPHGEGLQFNGGLVSLDSSILELQFEAMEPSDKSPDELMELRAPLRVLGAAVVFGTIEVHWYDPISGSDAEFVAPLELPLLLIEAAVLEATDARIDAGSEDDRHEVIDGGLYLMPAETS